MTSAFVAHAAPGAGTIAEAITVPTTVAELWMVGWLRLTGWRSGRG